MQATFRRNVLPSVLGKTYVGRSGSFRLTDSITFAMTEVGLSTLNIDPFSLIFKKHYKNNGSPTSAGLTMIFMEASVPWLKDATGKYI